MPIDVTVPSQGVDVSKAKTRANWAAIHAMIGKLPEVWTPFTPGEFVLVNDESSGIVPASLGTATMDGRGRTVRNVSSEMVPIGVSTSLTENAHNGLILKVATASAINLQVDLNADPALGVRHKFGCIILRPETAGALSISSSTLSNGSSDGLNRVSAGKAATLLVDADDLKYYLLGYAEA